MVSLWNIIDTLLRTLNDPTGPLGGIFSLAVFIPGIALWTRRLHDIDKSGWWVLSALLILPVILLLYWACQPGQRNDNQYGADVEAGR